jgi:hypothetical protein
MIIELKSGLYLVGILKCQMEREVRIYTKMRGIRVQHSCGLVDAHCNAFTFPAPLGVEDVSPDICVKLILSQ